MIEEIEIRQSLPCDADAIETLYPDAFPDEELLPVVRALLGEDAIALSLVAIVDRALVGHVIFTTCSIAGRPEKVALLGPLVVAQAWQRRGIGNALIREGLRRSEKAGAIQAYVLGDPGYYQRAGFKLEAGVAPPYPLPEAWRGAWQSVSLNNAEQPRHGTLSAPQPWRQPALWAP